MGFRQLELLWSASTLASHDAPEPHGSLRFAPSAAMPDANAHALDTLHALDARAQHYFDNARAQRTRLAYARDFGAFERWCAAHGLTAMPASSATLARYLTHLVEGGRKVSTVRRARIAIGLAHADAGALRPDRDARIRTLERGMGREFGTKEEGADPLLMEHVERIVATLGVCTRDDRDRALLLLGFAGAFRGSELVSIRIEDITWRDGGMDVFLARSKQDQLGAGDVVKIDRTQNAELCAVRAVRRWLDRVGEPQGRLLRSVAGERIGDAMQPRAISRVIQRHTARVAIHGDFSSHSLRAGLATSAHARGISSRVIQAHGRWKDRRSLDRYIAENVCRNIVACLC